jgi:hypothetical protein
MKKITFVFVSFIFFVIACNKKDDPQAQTIKSNMTANISLGNLSFKAKENETIALNIDNDTWAITGTNQAEDMLTLYIPINTAIGTYTMEGGINAKYRGHFFKQGDETYTNQPQGTITITEKTDKYIKGTFSFDAQGFSQIITGQTIAIREGNFTVLFF